MKIRDTVDARKRVQYCSCMLALFPAETNIVCVCGGGGGADRLCMRGRGGTGWAGRLSCWYALHVRACWPTCRLMFSAGSSLPVCDCDCACTGKQGVDPPCVVMDYGWIAQLRLHSVLLVSLVLFNVHAGKPSWNRLFYWGTWTHSATL